MRDDLPQPDRTTTEEHPEPDAPPHHEEDTRSSDHVVTIGGATVPYRATAGRMVLRKPDGTRRASFFYTAYDRSDVDDPAGRPIVFAFNGGPGSSSVWLHLGALGPRRVALDEEGKLPSLPGRLEENPHSLIDVADLVFVDPVGTGFSRPIPDSELDQFTHFRRDIESVGEFIRLYLGRHGRWASPKFLAGESYGTTRSAGLAGHLLEKETIHLNGLILISSVLNFQTGPFDRKTWTFQIGNDLPYVVFLPTYAAAAWYHGRVGESHRRRPLREFLDEVEAWAASEYLQALFAGDALDEGRATEVAARLSEYTGVSETYALRYRLRLEILRFCKQLRRDEALEIGRLDARYTGRGRFADGDSMESDPSHDAIAGAYAALLNDYVRRELAYETDLPYEVLSMDINEAWDYEEFKNAHVDTSETLRATMARNPHMAVFVAGGYYDLATPYYATEYTLGHMGLAPEARDRITMKCYEAGHMMYTHEPSLGALAADLRQFVVDAG